MSGPSRTRSASCPPLPSGRQHRAGRRTAVPGDRRSLRRAVRPGQARQLRRAGIRRPGRSQRGRPVGGIDLADILGPGMPGFGWLFDRLFGQASAGPPRGQDLRADLVIPLRRVRTGGKETVTIARPGPAGVMAAAFGIGAGLLGLEHGFFETLRGSTASGGLVIHAIGPVPAAHRLARLRAGVHRDPQPPWHRHSCHDPRRRHLGLGHRLRAPAARRPRPAAGGGPVPGQRRFHHLPVRPARRDRRYPGRCAAHRADPRGTALSGLLARLWPWLLVASLAWAAAVGQSRRPEAWSSGSHPPCRLPGLSYSS